jgi:hypothetical protein
LLSFNHFHLIQSISTALLRKNGFSLLSVSLKSK